MFSFFAQHGVSYTPSFIFRPYYPYFQTSEICVFTWVSFRIIFFFFPSLFYHHSSFSIAELQCILKLGSYLFLILLFLDSSIFPDDDLLFFPHILVNHFLPLDSSQFLLCGNTPLSPTSISALFSGIFHSLQRWFYTLFHISLEQRTKEWTRGKREPETAAPFKYLPWICGSEHLPEMWWMRW